MSFRVLSFVLLVLSACRAQDAPPVGSVQGNVYTNDVLGVTWEFPKEWATEKLPEQTKKGRGTLLLKLTPGANESVGLGADAYQDSPGFGYRYSDALTEMFQKDGWEVFGKRGYRTIGGGIHAEKNRFKSKNSPVRYVAVTSGPLRGFELKFMVQAASPERLDEIEKSLNDVRIRPDYAANQKIDQATSDSSRPRMVRISSGVSTGLLSKKVAPEYPADARRQHIQGTVVLLMHMNSNGHVQDLYAIEGHPLLVPAAVKAVSQWEYRPYMLDGQPVAIETQVVVNFELQLR